MTRRAPVQFSVLATPAFAAGCSSGEPHWSYSGEDGPSHWGETWTLAGTGREQSPIDITDPRPATLQEIEFHFETAPGTLVNTGHSIMIQYEGEGSWMRVDGIRYRFKQIHFHAPSEHTIDGKFADMEFHFVYQDEVGHLAVVAIMVEEGPRSPVIDEAWSRSPQTPGETVESPDLFADIEEVLPRDRRYYRYRGSLTTPPGTEGVTWLVLKTPLLMSSDRIDRFRSWYDHTNRPVPLHDRVVLEGR